MTSELTLPGIVLPGAVETASNLPALSRSPLSKYALTIADIHRLMLERGSLSAVVIKVSEGKPIGVSRIVQFTPFNKEELTEQTLEHARLLGQISPGRYVLAHVGSATVLGEQKTGVFTHMLILGWLYGIMPSERGNWSKNVFMIVPEDLPKIFGITDSQAAAYLKRFFALVNNPFSMRQAREMPPEELAKEVARRSTARQD